MILTLIFVGLFILGIIMIKLYRTTDIEIDIKIPGAILTVIFSIFSMLALLSIIAAHVGVDNEIKKNRIQYDSLVARQEIVNSEYEDVSKSDVLRDISEWNQMVQSNKYWGYSPWTNWFYSKRVTDALKFIE